MKKNQLNEIINISINKNMKYGVVINKLLVKGINRIIKNKEFELPLEYQGHNIYNIYYTPNSTEEERTLSHHNYTKQMDSMGEIILDEGLKEYYNNECEF